MIKYEVTYFTPEATSKGAYLFLHYNGGKGWFVDGKHHREDGPAYIHPDGSKRWYIHGKKHRIDGPAVELIDGERSWFLNDKHILKKEHPFNIFRNEYNLPEDYEEWPNRYKILFKLTYGGL
jgi:hypothetical protein